MKEKITITKKSANICILNLGGINPLEALPLVMAALIDIGGRCNLGKKQNEELFKAVLDMINEE